MASRRLFDGAQIELGLLPIEAIVVAGSKIWIKVAGTWKEATPFIKVSGTWKQATPFINVSGTWK